MKRAKVIRLRGEPMRDTHLRLSEALYQELRGVARKSGKSVNREMTDRLRWSLQAEQLRRVVVEAVEEAVERGKLVVVTT